MCKLHRRDFLFGLSGLLLSACGSNEYSDAKDYYPVAVNSTGTIYHWGKNNTIKVDSDSNSVATDSQESAFQSGANAWATTLSELGITISYVTSGPDVKVKWLTPSEMEAKAGSSGVLGYAATDKYIYMRTDLSSSTLDFVAIHEFGHMLGIWNHSYDSNDIMYPYAIGPTALSNRDKRTLADFLYQITPTADMHDLPGPSLVDPVTGATTPHIKTYFTTNGCVIQS
jgi:hypothetical protein